MEEENAKGSDFLREKFNLGLCKKRFGVVNAIVVMEFLVRGERKREKEGGFS